MAHASRTRLQLSVLCLHLLCCVCGLVECVYFSLILTLISYNLKKIRSFFCCVVDFRGVVLFALYFVDIIDLI